MRLCGLYRHGEGDFMADCNSEFTTFSGKIQLGTTRVSNLRRSRDAIRDRIVNYYKEKEKNVPDFCGQGSFKVKTGIVQLNEDYDIDYGVYLNHLPTEKEDWPSTKSIHREICEAVDGQTDTPVTDKHACVRVQYKKDYHVDLAIYGEYDGKIYLARTDSEKWEENNPKLFTQWFLDKKAGWGEQLRSVCQYIKKWSYYNGWIDDISGFLITILIGNHLHPCENRDDIALAETLKGIVTDIEYTRKILRPVYPYKNMIEKMPESKIDSMIEHFKDFRDNASKAVACVDKKEACAIWKDLFGDDFPLYKDDKKNNSSSIYTINRENKPWGN
jgi:hypothetical protein